MQRPMSSALTDLTARPPIAARVAISAVFLTCGVNMGVWATQIARIKQEPSWLDGKPCIVLDYSETSMVAQWIRDEIRLVAPGLYLGKVYWGKTRLIDFALQFPV
ncbi:MAG: hypothetical protein J0H57_24265 [Rhodospirillales bacterium]|nr:hypothetical protein [Rhodospirillales bacterium]